MTHDLDIIRRCIKHFEFDKLFNHLGWDHHRATLTVAVDGQQFTLNAIAHKKGFQVYECRILGGQPFPTSATCNKIQRQVAKSAHENLIIFTDEAQTRQSWKWAKREQGRLLKSRGGDFYKGHSGEALAQRLLHLAVTLDEEEEISLVDVTQRVRAAFDVDRVTKRFYERFKKEHTAFLKFIKGIKERTSREWYASLMLNRLMFVYFIQKKGFLDGDHDYLRNRLEATKKVKGRNKFHSFYRYFLLRLFHEGFGQRPDQRSPDLEELLGQVPYLNGGLFDVHELEREYPKIQIADEAFERLFDFFDQYQWHLDDRPLRRDTEINPDVLGYIFEKYINQKQMGAYYTKEDITEYISKNTIIPFLFNAAEKRCAVAFRRDGEVWQLLRDDPDRYIYDAVGHGIFVNIHTGERLGQPVPLPPEIAAGIDDVSKRGHWNKPAPPELALPTETWREHVARRERCEELRRKLAAAEVTSIDDLITLNLDICQFAQDVIDNCEGPELLRAFYYSIAGRIPQRSNETFQSGLSVLDPTCGSGAFLFAALNILQPLYEGCLERMEDFIREAEGNVPPSPEDEVESLIEQGESKHIEFKSTARYDVDLEHILEKVPENKRQQKRSELDKQRQHDILKAVAAMLNSEGGDLLIGVADNGTTVGIERDFEFFDKRKRNRDAYELWLTDLFASHFGKVVTQCIEASFVTRDGQTVCRLRIAPAPYPAYVREGNNKVLYIRTGNNSRALDTDEVVRYHKTRFEGPQRVRELSPTESVRHHRKRPKHQSFRRILEEVRRHPSRGYFILKSIIINNLFGVDIMPEAVEICKLRLFLKLVSQIDHVADLEPLPDIDFNIRAGNTLVGFVSLDQIRQAAKREQDGQNKIVFSDVEDDITRLEEEAEIVDRKFKMFRQQQTQLGGEVTAEHKADLRKSLQKLTDELDQYLAREYGVDPNQPKKFAEWRASHQPFHWFAEFYGIMADGGFDVIIGNPPYVEYKDVKCHYTVIGFSTTECGDLYAYVTERSLAILKDCGRLGLIVPISIFGTDAFSRLQHVVLAALGPVWISCFANRPAQLFDGAQKRLTILCGKRTRLAGNPVYTTAYYRWRKEERTSLFPARIRYVYRGSRFTVFPASLEKLGSEIEVSAFEKINNLESKLSNAVTDNGSFVLYYTRKFGYFLAFLDTIPEMREIGTGRKRLPSELKQLEFASKRHLECAIGILTSSTFFWFWNCLSDCRNLNRRDILAFPLPPTVLSNDQAKKLASVTRKYLRRLRSTSHTMTKSGLQIETFDYRACKTRLMRLTTRSQMCSDSLTKNLISSKTMT